MHIWVYFQSKVDKRLSDINGVKIYINDVLVLIKDSFPKYIYPLRVIFYRLCNYGLKVNTKIHFRDKEYSLSSLFDNIGWG